MENKPIENYLLYKEKRVNNRLIKHHLLLDILSDRDYTQIGYSVEGRSINLLKYGNGNKKVFIWSQMHGNEPTGTMAILDLLNVLEAENLFIEQLLSNLTIQIIPMVNPDGADLFQRTNAMNIDINRDFIKKQAPETSILQQAIHKFSPQVCFNLHDQRSIFSVSGYKNPATVSFLAPSQDKDKTLTEKRRQTMGIISHINQTLQEYAPDHIGRYSDEFYPNAFGDNLQKEGYNSILIEAGGAFNDSQRQQARYLNWIALIIGLDFIASTDDFSKNYELYQQIPENDKKMLDKIFRNVMIRKNNCQSIVDLGITQEEKPYENNNKRLIKKPKITHVGDLDAYTGYEEVQAQRLMFYKKERNYPILNEAADFELITAEKSCTQPK